MRIGDVLTFENEKYNIRFIYKNYLLLASLEKDDDSQPGSIDFVEVKEQNEIVKVTDPAIIQEMLYVIFKNSIFRDK